MEVSNNPCSVSVLQVQSKGHTPQESSNVIVLLLRDANDQKSCKIMTVWEILNIECADKENLQYIGDIKSEKTAP